MPTRHPRQMITLTPDRTASCPRSSISAVGARGALARRGHHRTASPSDLLIAACAHIHESGVLHYDRGYDVLLELTELRFESQWLAPAGSL